MKRIGKNSVVYLFACLMLVSSLSMAERTTTYLHNDALGSVVAATNEQGEVIWRKDYAAFGERAGWIIGDQTDEAISYTGKQYDDKTGLIYFGARYYDPEIGRFISRDPAHVLDYIENSPHMFNRYTYANNNPYKYLDLDGREPTKSQSITWDQAKVIIGGKGLDSLRYTEKAGGGGGQVGPFGGASGGRYIYTENRGWIDLAHFFQVASEANKHIPSGLKPFMKTDSSFLKMYAYKKLWDSTVLTEDGQAGYPTSWSYEDAPSNLAGLDFYIDYYSSDDKLTSALDSFFKNAGAKKPSSAPNWGRMQEKESGSKQFFPPNKSFLPAEF
ncbi:RHS repeat-associated core domain-containing protein [Teredinibacter sp. KSP-S5-2]|uniref:RHS repeat domain-containing protein n=1 Tax=Teredinibacter sp. KSP-S5-2 TaxID=3034506 RepID=UPI0029348035|nr:RHS repeat-associated core domain-containing protein [Teredinibacter sp. KSP-S5-2]WNO10577.1 RHS repeat-associated core domain-containing protein [Teredinibacter sp. KSP-S5-2]